LKPESKPDQSRNSQSVKISNTKAEASC